MCVREHVCLCVCVYMPSPSLSPGQASSAGVLHTGNEVLQEGVLVGLQVQGQVALQSFQDCGGVGQGQALAQDT